MSASLKTQDDAIQRILAGLQTQIEAMGSCQRSVANINDEVHQHFIAAASTIYQQKIDDWQNQYTRLQGAYQTFTETLNAGYGGISNAHDEAMRIASNAPIGPVHAALRGA